MGTFFTDEEMAERREIARNNRDELLAELTGLCRICKEEPVWIVPGIKTFDLCQDCFDMTSN